MRLCYGIRVPMQTSHLGVASAARWLSYRWYSCSMDLESPADAPGGPSLSPPRPAQRRFQVLALDGGGVGGIFTAALLAGLEDDTGRPVVDLFDLVVGTSTGGIIALGLGAGLTPREILEFYVSEKDRIFPNRFGWRAVRQVFAAKYRPGPLQAALQRIFEERLLGESRVPLVIPAYNLGENDVYLFKTPHHGKLKRDHKVPMWAVAMATSAAPTFFPRSGCRPITSAWWTAACGRTTPRWSASPRR